MTRHMTHDKTSLESKKTSSMNFSTPKTVVRDAIQKREISLRVNLMFLIN